MSDHECVRIAREEGAKHRIAVLEGEVASAQSAIDVLRILRNRESVRAEALLRAIEGAVHALQHGDERTAGEILTPYLLAHWAKGTGVER